jgi:hypothetical protein
MTTQISVPMSRLKSVKSLALIFALPPGKTRATLLPAVACGVYELKGFLDPWCDVECWWWRGLVFWVSHDVKLLGSWRVDKDGQKWT